jgi:hypothetical protein
LVAIPALGVSHDPNDYAHHQHGSFSEILVAKHGALAPLRGILIPCADHPEMSDREAQSLLTVQSALRQAAHAVRAQLLSGQLTPASFQAQLTDIPRRERDQWLDLLWGFDEIPDDGPELPRGCAPYLPCPVATVLEAVRGANLSSDDVFVDLGSGAGRTTLLANLLTGAACVGLEIQRGLVQAARERAEQLNLDRLRFVEGDAAELLRSIRIGTVFFLYSPFDRNRVDRVLDDLEVIARTRPIRICCVQMPAIERPWFVRVSSSSVELDIYRSMLLHEEGG